MKKITVMIVDDEKLVLEDLTTIVDWDVLDFQIVATAVNGKQALAKFKKLRPQIVFTDIRMPYMDGIELIRKIRQFDKQTQILLLTAYEDFSYAKSAIECGITDYIIKSSINEEIMTDILKRLKGIVNKQGQVYDIVKEKEISDYFANTSYDIEKTQDPKLFSTPFYYFIVEQAMPVNLVGDDGIDHIKCMKNDIVSLLLDNVDGNYNMVATGSIFQEQLLVIVSINESSQSAIKQILLQCATEKWLRLKERFHVDFNVYVITNRQDIQSLKKNYIQYLTAFPKRYFDLTETIVDLSDYTFQDKGSEELVLDTDYMISTISKLDHRMLTDYIQYIYDEIIAEEDYRLLSIISKELFGMLKHLNAETPERENKLDLSFENNWKYWTKAASIKDWMIQSFSTIVDVKKKSNENKLSKPIAKSIEFIYKKYGNAELSINDISEHVGLSTGHLCVLFKKETGKTLNNYLSEVRIDEAKRLLKHKQLKVYEIAATTGFQSSQYFSQVFHKFVGMYPNEYQRGINPDR